MYNIHFGKIYIIYEKKTNNLFTFFNENVIDNIIVEFEIDNYVTTINNIIINKKIIFNKNDSSILPISINNYLLISDNNKYNDYIKMIYKNNLNYYMIEYDKNLSEYNCMYKNKEGNDIVFSIIMLKNKNNYLFSYDSNKLCKSEILTIIKYIFNYENEK